MYSAVRTKDRRTHNRRVSHDLNWLPGKCSDKWNDTCSRLYAANATFFSMCFPGQPARDGNLSLCVYSPWRDAVRAFTGFALPVNNGVLCGDGVGDGHLADVSLPVIRIVVLQPSLLHCLLHQRQQKLRNET